MTQDTLQSSVVLYVEITKLEWLGFFHIPWWQRGVVVASLVSINEVNLRYAEPG